LYFFIQNVWNRLQNAENWQLIIAFDLWKKVYFLVNREIPAILPGYPNHLIYIAGGKIHSAMQHYYFYNPNTKVCLKKIVLHIYNSKCVTVLLKETLSYLKLVSFGLWRTVLLLQFIFQKISIQHTVYSKKKSLKSQKFGTFNKVYRVNFRTFNTLCESDLAGWIW
jgi:uncharacterized membrane protein